MKWLKLTAVADSGSLRRRHRFRALRIAADAAEDVLRGKTVQVLVGFGPGGGYDLYARTLARYLGKHIPGNPTVVTAEHAGRRRR